MNVIQKHQTTATRPQIREVAITALKAHNDGPTSLSHTTWLYATVGTGSNVRYEWDCGDGYTARGANVRHTYTQPGEYRATVIARNATNMMTATTFVIVGQSDIYSYSPVELGDESRTLEQPWAMPPT